MNEGDSYLTDNVTSNIFKKKSIMKTHRSTNRCAVNAHAMINLSHRPRILLFSTNKPKAEGNVVLRCGVPKSGNVTGGIGWPFLQPLPQKCFHSFQPGRRLWRQYHIRGVGPMILSCKSEKSILQESTRWVTPGNAKMSRPLLRFVRYERYAASCSKYSLRKRM